MSQPLVSIVTPTYNSEAFILRTIQSVLRQSLQDWEMLITDDGSTDHTVAIIQAQASLDSRIKCFVLDKNSGAGVARNHSITHASGRYIAFLDGDDMWAPDKLEKQVAFMQQRDCTMSYTSYYTCEVNDEVSGIVICPREHSLADNKRDNKVGFSTLIYDAERLGKVLMPTIRRRQDWGLNMTLLKLCGNAYGMIEPLTYYRKREGSLSNDKLSMAKHSIDVYQIVLGWTKLKAILWFLFMYMPCWSWKKLVVSLYNR